MAIPIAIPIPIKSQPRVPHIPEGFEHIARGREAHPGSPWKRENNPGGVEASATVERESTGPRSDTNRFITRIPRQKSPPLPILNGGGQPP
jgi:hypothetical protein